MQGKGLQPGSVTFLGVVNALGTLVAFEGGKLAQEQIIRRGFESDVFVASSLVDMHAKCGSIEDLLRVFTGMPTRTAVSWNAMTVACVKCGQPEKAMELAKQMQAQHVKPDSNLYRDLVFMCCHPGY